jgi:hypothetical protein
VEYVIELSGVNVKKSTGTSLFATFDGLSLRNGQKVQASITCRNAAQKRATVRSSAVTVDLTGPTISGLSIDIPGGAGRGTQT